MSRVTLIFTLYVCSVFGSSAYAWWGGGFPTADWDGSKGPAIPPYATTGDEDVKAKEKEAYLAYLERQVEVYKEQKKVLEDHNTESFVVFVSAHIVLLLGLIAAATEFLRARKTRKDADKQTDLNVSLQGIALKTSLHGTILLALSISFYFLYLKFVYPITAIG